MAEACYAFAGVVFRFRSPIPLPERQRYEQFRVPADTREDFLFDLLPQPAGTKPVLRHSRDGSVIRVRINQDLMEKNTAAVYLVTCGAALLVERGCFILHASYVLHAGQAILFCAPSETGKSTQAAFWEAARGSRTVNEDRVILREENGVWYAHGCWATGTSDLCRNETAPVRAVILLEQGPENRVRELPMLQKLQKLAVQCSFDENTQSGTILDLCTRLMSRVPVISYACRNHISAVTELEKHL